MILSIIVPIYNGGKTLSNLIEPILEIKRDDIEFILVDDGSTDNTNELCEFYAKKDSRVRTISIKNSGVSTARNMGLGMATGKYIYFCDCDDFVFADTLEKTIALLENNNYDLVTADYINMFLNSGKSSKNHTDLPAKRLLNKQDIINCFITPLVLRTGTGLAALWNKFFLLDTIKKNNIEFNSKIHKGEDWQFILRFLEQSTTAYYSPEVLYEYRLDGSQSETKYKREPGIHLLDSTKLKMQLANKFNINVPDDLLTHWCANIISKLVFLSKSPIKKYEWNCVVKDSFVSFSAKRLLHIKSKEYLRLEISRKYKLYSFFIVLRLNKFLRFIIIKTN